MGISVLGGTTSGSTSSSVAGVPTVSVSNQALSIGGSTNSFDFACAQTVTGRRFQFEYRWLNPAAGVAGAGIAWTGLTAVAGSAYIETPSTTASTPYTITRNTNTFVGSGVSGTTNMVPLSLSSAGAGLIVGNGVIEFNGTGPVTLTPVAWSGASVQNLYMRHFSVQILA